jgi:hypothetical protein
MNNFKYLLFLCLSFGLFSSCEYDSFEEESGLKGVEGTEQNPFIRLDNSLQGSAAVGEDDGGISIEIQNLFPVETDVTVTYSLGGTATFGEDYTISGATASGGDIVVPFDASTVGISTAGLSIDIINDCTIEEGETIVLELVDAKADDGSAFDVGQGDLHKAVTIALNEVESVVGFAAMSTEYTDTEPVDTVSVAVGIADFNAACPPSYEVTVDGSSTSTSFDLLTTELVFDGTTANLVVEVEISADADTDNDTVVLKIAETTSTGIQISSDTHTINITDSDQ